MQFLKSPYITAPFYSFPLLCCTVQYMHLLQCGRSRMFIPFPGSDFLPSQITDRVGNGISFRKNSAEKTRNDFRYSAEESIHSEAFRVPRKSQFRSSERNGMERNFAKNEVLRNLHSFSGHSDGLYILLWLFFSSAEWFGTEFREFASILVPRNGIPSYFLFRGRVRNGIPRFSVPRNNRNSVGNNHLFRLFRLPRNKFFVGNSQP